MKMTVTALLFMKDQSLRLARPPTAPPTAVQMAHSARIPIRVFFTNRKEMERLLKTFGYTPESNDKANFHYKWSSADAVRDLYVSNDIFDRNDDLKPIETDELTREFVSAETKSLPPPDDDIPF